MTACLLDCHVHLYDAFPPAAFLDAAAGTVARQARRAGLPGDTPGVLMLVLTPAERAPAEVFDPVPPGWTARVADGHGTLCLSRAGAPDLHFVPGRQIVTAEGLEVLGLGLTRPVAGGLPSAETIRRVAAAGAVPVLPYGVGKWLGRRGALVRALAADPAMPADLAFGDISGRLGLFGRPALLTGLEAGGRIVLPGSDPLPFPDEVAKVARLVCRAEVDPAAPRDSMLAWIRALGRSPEALGRHEAPARFVRLQAAMQVAKRRRAQASSKSAA